MNIFYINGNFEVDEFVLLDDREHHHAYHVMRIKEGESIHLCNGLGYWFEGLIVSLNKKEFKIKIAKVTFIEQDPFQLEIAVAPPKSKDRLDWMLEKLTEVGVNSIVLIETARTERSRINIDRMQNELIAALKQCKRKWLPQIRISKLDDYIKNLVADKKYILSLNKKDSVGLASKNSPMSISVLIGPEGDFTMEETANCLSKGFEHLYLGDFVLRTETAAIYIASALKCMCK